jgi:hypothetical protein
MPENAKTDGREHCCDECSKWFLGCLNGREKWKDEAIRPNFRWVTLEDGSRGGMCDAFELHPDPCRQGRVVWDCTCPKSEG